MSDRLKTEKILIAFSALKEARLTKLDGEGRYLVLKALRETLRIVDDFQQFIESTKEQLKPENIQDLQERLKNLGNLDKVTKEQTETEIAAYQSQVDECVKMELASEKAIENCKLNETTFIALIESNDFNITELLAIQDLLS